MGENVLHLIHNEQTKLHATWFNNASVGMMLRGSLPASPPVPSTKPGLARDLSSFQQWGWAGTAVGALIVSALLHGAAVHELRKLRED